jgi:myo-inositol-1(or 4)-monophosphatase
VAEEGAAHPAAPGAGPGAATWYVDPLDGTVNFSHGLPLFAVSIGLQAAGEPTLGVVHAPAVGWTFVGGPGHGATRNGAVIAPSATAALDRALLVTGFPTARTARAANTPAFLAYNQVAEGLRRLGSAALDLCFVACGWLDGTWQRNLSPWDTVGGAAVLLGAGGTLTGLQGETFDPRDGGIVASNGHIHAEMLAVLTALRS